VRVPNISDTVTHTAREVIPRLTDASIGFRAQSMQRSLRRLNGTAPPL